jgi:hypothetical protein
MRGTDQLADIALQERPSELLRGVGNFMQLSATFNPSMG